MNYYRVVKTKNSCLLIWDFENLKVPNNLALHYFDAARNLQNGLKNLLDNINITSFKVCGNSTSTSTNALQRRHVYLGGAELADIPIVSPDASDREMIIEIVKYVRDHPPPGFICLMSGDEDLFQILGWLGDHGYTTVLLEPDDCCSSALNKMADYRIVCSRLFVETYPVENPFTLIERYTYQEEKSFDTIVFWDAVGCPHLHHEAALRYIQRKVLQEIGGDSIEIRLYNEFEEIPPKKDRLRGVTYVGTSSSKTSSLANMLFCDLVTCAAKPILPKNVVLISDDLEFSRGLLFLERLEVKVYRVMRRHLIPHGVHIQVQEQRFQMLEAAGSLLFHWPPPAQEIERPYYSRGGDRPYYSRGGDRPYYSRGGDYNWGGDRHYNWGDGGSRKRRRND